MWDENKLNMIYPGQMTSFNPAGTQISHMDAMKLEPLSGVPEKTSLADSSRKRKATAVEQQDSKIFNGLSESVRNNLREELTRLLLRGSDGNLPKAAHEKISPLLSDQQNLAYDLASKIEGGIFQSYSGATDVYIEKAQAILLNLKDGVNSGLISQQQKDKSEHASHFPSAIDKKCSQDFTKSGSSTNIKWSSQNMHANNIEDVSNRVETRHGSVIVETSKAVKLSSHENTYSDDGTLTDRLEVSGDNLEMHSKKDGSNMENSGTAAIQKQINRDVGDDLGKSSLDLDGLSKLDAGKAVPPSHEELWDGLLQLNTSTIVTAVAYFKSGEKAPKVDWYKTVEVKGKVRLEAFEKFIQELPRSRNRALMVISICWKAGSSKNGLMGMKEVAKNYKEGERVGFAQLSPGIDLYVCPRSDTIITILAKYGFYKGMAIAEVDQDSLIGCVVWRRNRVVSNSVSKQPTKKKVEQPTDSPGSSSISQTAETSSPVLYLQNPELNYSKPLTQPVGYSSPLTSETKPVSVESSVMATDNKNLLSTKDISGVDISVRSSLPNQGSLVPDPSLLTATGTSTSRYPDPSFLRDTMGSSSEIETPTTSIRDPRKPDMGFDLSRPPVSEPLQILQKAQQAFSGSDDDDLPEFDFNAACGISQCPQSEVPLSCDKVQILDSHLNAGIKDSSGPMCTAFPIARPVFVANYQSPHPVSFPSLPLNTHQGMSQQAKKPGEQESKVSGLASRMENSVATGAPGNVKAGVVAPIPAVNSCVSQKHIWDDDEDDMPEWCPPYLENQNQTATSAGITRAPTPHLENLNQFAISTTTAVTRPPNPYFDIQSQSATSAAGITRAPPPHPENLNQSAASTTPVTKPPNPRLENMNQSATSAPPVTRPPNPYLENQGQSSTSAAAIIRSPNPYLENRNPFVTSAGTVTRPQNPPVSEMVCSGLLNAPPGPTSRPPLINRFCFHDGYPPRFPDQHPSSNNFPPAPPRPIGGQFEIHLTSPFGYNMNPPLRPRLSTLEPRPPIRPVNGRGWRFGNS